MARNGRPTPMDIDKPTNHQPAARRSIKPGNKNSNQLSFPPTLDGGDEEDENEGDDSDDDDEPQTSDEEQVSLATSPGEDSMDMQNLSSLQFSPAPSMAPPECRLYPPYHSNTSQYTGSISSPPFTTSMPHGVPTWGSYPEHTNLEGVGPSTSPLLTLQDTHNFLDGKPSCHEKMESLC